MQAARAVEPTEAAARYVLETQVQPGASVKIRMEPRKIRKGEGFEMLRKGESGFYESIGKGTFTTAHENGELAALSCKGSNGEAKFGQGEYRIKFTIHDDVHADFTVTCNAPVSEESPMQVWLPHHMLASQLDESERKNAELRQQLEANRLEYEQQKARLREQWRTAEDALRACGETCQAQMREIDAHKGTTEKLRADLAAAQDAIQCGQLELERCREDAKSSKLALEKRGNEYACLNLDNEDLRLKLRKATDMMDAHANEIVSLKSRLDTYRNENDKLEALYKAQSADTSGLRDEIQQLKSAQSTMVRRPQDDSSGASAKGMRECEKQIAAQRARLAELERMVVVLQASRDDEAKKRQLVTESKSLLSERLLRTEAELSELKTAGARERAQREQLMADYATHMLNHTEMSASLRNQLAAKDGEIAELSRQRAEMKRAQIETSGFMRRLEQQKEEADMQASRATLDLGIEREAHRATQARLADANAQLRALMHAAAVGVAQPTRPAPPQCPDCGLLLEDATDESLARHMASHSIPDA